MVNSRDNKQDYITYVFSPMFNALSKDRHLVNSPDNKQDYINYVKSSKSQVQSSLDNLSNKPPSDVGCSGLSKRGILSAISKLAGDVGSLLSCSKQILGDLEDAVEKPDPDIDDQTDALQEISNNLDKDEDNQSSSQSQSQSRTSSDSSTATTTTTGMSSTSSRSTLSTTPTATDGTASNSATVTTNTPASTTTSGANSATSSDQQSTISSSTSADTTTTAAHTTTAAPPPPPPPPPAEDTCNTKYKFWYEQFTIYGKNFDPSKFGTKGSGLKKQIKGCGALTKWKFKRLTDDPEGYKWEATGHLPIDTGGCVHRAVVSAGGSPCEKS